MNRQTLTDLDLGYFDDECRRRGIPLEYVHKWNHNHLRRFGVYSYEDRLCLMDMMPAYPIQVAPDATPEQFARAQDHATEQQAQRTQRLAVEHPTVPSVCRVAITGTSSDARLEPRHLNRMLHLVSQRLQVMGPSAGIHLVTGGSPWADHIVVQLFQTGKYASLTLHLPCHWNRDAQRFEGKDDPSRVLNRRHRAFQQATGIDSLAQLQHVIQNGARVHVHSGFHARNEHLSQADHLIMLGFDAEPQSPGLHHLWLQSPNRELLFIENKHDI